MNGQNVYVDFNGQRLYSCDVTMESAYMQIIGMTKEEDDAIRQEYTQAETEEEREAIIAKWAGIRNKYMLKVREAELSVAEAEVAKISKEEAVIEGTQEEQK